MIRRKYSFKMVAFLVSLVLLGCTSVEENPVCNGRIAYVASGSGGADIYSINPDGSNKIRLTSNEGFGGYPAWSNDGKKIAFILRDRHEGGIYVMDGDVTNQTKVFNTNGAEVHPSWSPDGQSIAFIKLEDTSNASEFGIINLEGDLEKFDHTNSLKIPSPNFWPVSIKWSPTDREWMLANGIKLSEKQPI